MKNRTQALFSALILLAALGIACSAPADTSNSANVNSANANVAQQAPLPQNGTATATSESGAPTASAPPRTQPAPSVAPAPPAPDAAQVAGGPKIVVPVKKIDFGLQAKDKTLVRTITVKNGGKSELKIDAVEPS